MNREPAVADRFYPGNPSALRRDLAELIPKPGSTPPIPAIAVVSPHAGYFYSGRLAGETFAAVQIPQDVLILGPNHHGHGSPLALMARGSWRMPMGAVPINQELAALLLDQWPGFEDDELAHRNEHSLEVQVPFLQSLQPELRLVPLVISQLSLASCQDAGEAIAAAIKAYGKPVLMVASSDMTHYQPRKVASARDAQAIEQILNLDPEGLYNTVLSQRISMCGFIPTTITLFAANKLGASTARLVRYTDSGEAGGDTEQVVGYAGFVVA